MDKNAEKDSDAQRKMNEAAEMEKRSLNRTDDNKTALSYGLATGLLKKINKTAA